jgi:DedD protein
MERRVKERLVGASILAVLIVLIVPELLSGPATAPVGTKLPLSAPEPVRNVTVDLATAKPPVPEPAMTAAPTPGPQAQGSPSATAASAEGGAAETAGAGGTTGAGETAGASRTTGAGETAGAGRTTGATETAGAGAITDAGAVRGGTASSAPLESAVPAPTTPANAVVSKAAAANRGWAVQLGSFASRSNADKLARQVRGQGFTVLVLSSGSGATARYRVRVGPLADRGAATQTAARLKSLGHAGSLVSPGA